jgi:hypothetical protein
VKDSRTTEFSRGWALSRAAFALAVVKFALQWVGVLTLLLTLVAWLDWPAWARVVAVLLSWMVMLVLLRVEVAIRLRDLNARLAELDVEGRTHQGPG